MDWHYLAAYGTGSLVVFTVMIGVMSIGMKRPLPHAGMGALGSAGSNSGFIGYSIALLVLGEVAKVGLALST